MIVVCPRSKLEAALIEHRPGRIVSLLSAGHEPFRPEGMAETRQLHLSMHDIAADRPGLVSPALAHVEALLAFARSWDGQAPLLIHCYAGVSRSPAAAFIVAAALKPDHDEAELASALRALSPSATPNPYLVRLADAALGRDGRMVRAIERIGRGRDCFEGEVFGWALG
ncbi:MAG TPA: protein tyrosine phosphatase [Mesorhizobium sp.]|nr:protein tyrosine phosphatase [Mesorhizobium sp.]